MKIIFVLGWQFVKTNTSPFSSFNQKFKQNYFNITWNNLLVYELAWNVFNNVK